MRAHLHRIWGGQDSHASARCLCAPNPLPHTGRRVPREARAINFLVYQSQPSCGCRCPVVEVKEPMQARGVSAWLRPRLRGLRGCMRSSRRHMCVCISSPTCVHDEATALRLLMATWVGGGSSGARCHTQPHRTSAAASQAQVDVAEHTGCFTDVVDERTPYALEARVVYAWLRPRVEVCVYA
jgi:hypothetical protein